MAIAYRAASSASGNEATFAVVSTPTGTTAGDVLVAFVQKDRLTSWGSPPTGFTQVGTEASGTNGSATHYQRAYVKVAGSAEPGTYTWTGGTADMTILLAVYSGVDNASPVDQSGWSGANSPSITAPSVTTTGDGARVVCGFGVRSLNQTLSVPAGTFSRTSAAASGVASSGLLVDFAQAAAGATGDKVSTSAHSPNTGYTVALKAANAAPNAPVPTAPADGAGIDRTATQRFDWDFSDPDAGDTQSAYNFRYRATGAPSWVETGWQSTPTTYHDVTGGTFTDGVGYEWQVATKDAQGAAGPFTSSRFFTAATAPTSPTITTPTNGGTFLQTQGVEWSTPDQDAYQIRVLDDLDAVVSDTGTVTDGTTRSVVLEFPDNGVSRTVQVRVQDGGLWSAYAEVSGTVSWVAPPTPTFTLLADPDTGSLGVSITNPAPTGEEPAAVYNDVHVDDGDGEFRMATNVAPNGAVTYWLPKSGRDYSTHVRVVAVAENGVTASSS